MSQAAARRRPWAAPCQSHRHRRQRRQTLQQRQDRIKRAEPSKNYSLEFRTSRTTRSARDKQTGRKRQARGSLHQSAFITAAGSIQSIAGCRLILRCACIKSLSLPARCCTTQAAPDMARKKLSVLPVAAVRRAIPSASEVWSSAFVGLYLIIYCCVTAVCASCTGPFSAGEDLQPNAVNIAARAMAEVA